MPADSGTVTWYSSVLVLGDFRGVMTGFATNQEKCHHLESKTLAV